MNIKKIKYFLLAFVFALSVFAAVTTSKAAFHRDPYYGFLSKSGSNIFIRGEIVGGVHQPLDLTTKTLGVDYSCDSDVTATCTVTITATPVEIGTSNIWQVASIKTTVRSIGEYSTFTF
ncbi:hypothetical protein GA0116948_11035 [Chitinophaga costaii]|uniref:IPT/TIG domain-containing protein n=1 Tax=Chitinophaga costaii TaxID=1335309 RepID=A0A1C4EVE1_9BACT|nr:hypothetical protein [Chitinophaga costaii]SCC47597.1 hypothetical protein GA0116948_11035 [Chitinophaga costaii]